MTATRGSPGTSGDLPDGTDTTKLLMLTTVSVLHVDKCVGLFIEDGVQRCESVGIRLLEGCVAFCQNSGGVLESHPPNQI